MLSPNDDSSQGSSSLSHFNQNPSTSNGNDFHQMQRIGEVHYGGEYKPAAHMSDGYSDMKMEAQDADHSSTSPKVPYQSDLKMEGSSDLKESASVAGSDEHGDGDEDESGSSSHATSPSSGPSVKKFKSEDGMSEDVAGAKPAKPRRRRDKNAAPSIICQYKDPNERECKQRAILSYHYCIRHILNDPSAPYVQCEHHRKPKSRKDTQLRCTNAIRKESKERFCSTHLIMNGLKEPKKRGGAAASQATDSTSDCSTPGVPDIYTPGGTMMMSMDHQLNSPATPSMMRPSMSSIMSSPISSAPASQPGTNPGSPAVFPSAKTLLSPMGNMHHHHHQPMPSMMPPQMHLQPSATSAFAPPQQSMLPPIQLPPRYPNEVVDPAMHHHMHPHEQQQQHHPQQGYHPHQMHPDHMQQVQHHPHQQPYPPHPHQQMPPPQHPHAAHHHAGYGAHHQQAPMHPPPPPGSQMQGGVVHPQQQHQQQMQGHYPPQQTQQQQHHAPPPQHQGQQQFQQLGPPQSGPMRRHPQMQANPPMVSPGAVLQAGPQQQQSVPQQQQQQHLLQQQEQQAAQQQQHDFRHHAEPVLNGTQRHDDVPMTNSPYNQQPPHHSQAANDLPVSSPASQPLSRVDDQQQQQQQQQFQQQPQQQQVVPSPPPSSQSHTVPSGQPPVPPSNQHPNATNARLAAFQQQIQNIQSRLASSGRPLLTSEQIVECRHKFFNKRVSLNAMKQHPQLAARLLDGRGGGVNVLPGASNGPLRQISIVNPHNGTALPFSAPPIRSTSPSDDDKPTINGLKVIHLRQKRQKKRMVGPYRRIPQVDQMCRAMEDADFDRTDLFPLGLEPSDDEDTNLWTSSVLPASSFSSFAADADPGVQLYLVKKQLRLEKHSLIKQAQLNAPLMYTSRRYPTSVGAALRQREDSASPPPKQLAPAPLRRCCQLEQDKQRCARSCLPMSNHCAGHVMFNVNQRQFSYCTHSFCGKPVPVDEAWLWDGRCASHREAREDKYGPIPLYDDSLYAMGFGVSSVAQSSTSAASPPNAAESSISPNFFTNGTTSHAPTRGHSGGGVLAASHHHHHFGSNGQHSATATGYPPMEEETGVPEDLLEGNSWEDIEQFLMSEGFPVDSPPC